MQLVFPRAAQLWPFNASGFRQLMLGYAVAFVSAQGIIGFDLALAGFTSAHLSAGRLALSVSMALIAAALISPLEELIFRGLILIQFSRLVGEKGAVFLSAVFFAGVHLIAVVPFGSVFAVFMRENNLLVIGLLLGGAFLRSRTLWFNTGLYGGWIFTLILFTGVTRRQEPPRIPYLGGDLLANPITTVVLIFVSLWVWRFYHPQPNLAVSGPSAPSI